MDNYIQEKTKLIKNNYKVNQSVAHIIDEVAERDMPYPKASNTLVKVGKAIHIVAIIVAVFAIIASIIATYLNHAPIIIWGIISAALIYIPGLAIMTLFKVIANIAYCQRESLRITNKYQANQ